MRIGIKILGIVAFLFFACKGQGNDKEMEIEKNTEEITEIEVPSKKEKENHRNSDLANKSITQTDFSFLDDFKTVSLPFKDSTNFDNHKADKLLTHKQIESLGLDKALGIPSTAIENSKIGVNYILDLSPNFKSIVFYLYFFDHEMSSTLVNYDSEFNIIDKKTLAMDEIAEGILRKESLIEKNRITITNYQFLNEKIEETEIVKVQSDGKIKTWR